MAIPDFWHDLAAEFRALPGGNTLRGDWDYTANSGRPYEWHFAEGTRALHARFEALARRAASEMPNPEYSDLLLSWLEALRKNCHQPGITNTYTDQNEDGSEGPVHVVGSLRNLCEESAIYCDQLESETRQKAFNEKQRNNPRNWSGLQQDLEAFRSLKEIRNQPAERIPEEFARNSIARMYGIKPEEVTSQQIKFEISRLLPFYHRIEVVPSATQQEPAPEAKPSDQAEPNTVPAVSPPDETIAAQIRRFRDECRWTNEDLAEAADLSTRQVARHVSGEAMPYKRNIGKYERVFSKKLKRQIVISEKS